MSRPARFDPRHDMFMYPCSCLGEFSRTSRQNPRFILAGQDIVEFPIINNYIGRTYHSKSGEGYRKTEQVIEPNDHKGEILIVNEGWRTKCSLCGLILDKCTIWPQETKCPAFKRVLGKT